MNFETFDWRSLYLSAQGRIGRREFWIGAAGLIAVGLAVGIIPVVGALASLAMLYPWTCLTAKRLHDFGRSGWLVLIAAVPAAVSGALGVFMALAASNLATLGVAMASAGLALTVSALALLASLAFLLWVALKPGERSANAYGAAVG